MVVRVLSLRGAKRRKEVAYKLFPDVGQHKGRNSV